MNQKSKNDKRKKWPKVVTQYSQTHLSLEKKCLPKKIQKRLMIVKIIGHENTERKGTLYQEVNVYTIKTFLNKSKQEIHIVFTMISSK